MKKNISLKIKLISLSLILLSCLLQSKIVLAKNGDFDHEYIISDYQLTDYESMTAKEIQSFLEKNGGAIKNYLTDDVDGREKSAAEIIYRAGQEYKINPKILITLLQREKGLITKKNPSQDDYNWATGFSCYDYAPIVKKFRGFARQVDRAAWRFCYYLEHPWQFQFKSGAKTKTLSNSKDSWLIKDFGRFVAPKNAATANLYNYAPHLFDNWLFWSIWQNWFGQQDQKFPEGTLIRVKNEKGVWLIQNGQRHPFLSKNIFLLNYKFEDVKDIEKNDLLNYEIGEPVNFPNYSLVQDDNNQIYMLVDQTKRPVSEKMFKAIGYNSEEIIKVEQADLIYYIDGNSITSPYPSGALLQDKTSKGVYYVKENKKYPIICSEILNANFPYNYIIKTETEELNKFESGEPVKFKDGILIKTHGSPTVYLISEGKRLPINSAETFDALGYQWDSIITVSNEILNLHSLSNPLEITAN